MKTLLSTGLGFCFGLLLVVPAHAQQNELVESAFGVTLGQSFARLSGEKAGEGVRFEKFDSVTSKNKYRFTPRPEERGGFDIHYVVVTPISGKVSEIQATRNFTGVQPPVKAVNQCNAEKDVLLNILEKRYGQSVSAYDVQNTHIIKKHNRSITIGCPPNPDGPPALNIVYGHGYLIKKQEKERIRLERRKINKSAL